MHFMDMYDRSRSYIRAAKSFSACTGFSSQAIAYMGSLVEFQGQYRPALSQFSAQSQAQAAQEWNQQRMYGYPRSALGTGQSPLANPFGRGI